MAGRNQHHIPQFHQRGFGVRRSGKPKEIWEYRKGVEPHLSEIKRTAAEDWFYSSLSGDGAKTLDDQITERETPIARMVDVLRRMAVGSAVDAADATEVLIHLTPRTSHLRSTFAHAMAGLVEGVREIFTEEVNLKASLGLDTDQPSDQFRSNVAEHIGPDSVFAQLGLPRVVLERVTFWLAKENFNRLIDEQLPQFKTVLKAMAQTAPQFARDGHKKAISKLLADGSKRDDLLTYSWTLQAAPPEGTILPDCIAFALLKEGAPRPFIGTAGDDIQAVVLPLSTERLLIGTKGTEFLPEFEKINIAAARCCYGFFLAANDSHRNLADEIGLFATADIDEGLNNAIQNFRIERDPAPMTQNLEIGPAREDEDTLEQAASGNFTYRVSCLDFGDQELVGRIADVLKHIVAELARIIPLDRLDGITFAADYQAGLRAVDRGIPNLPPPKSANDDVGVGVAMTLPVKRDDVVKGHIVLNGCIGLGLVDATDAFGKVAIHTLVHKLAQVSMIQLLDQALPGVILRPLADPHEGRLFVSVHGALDNYAASRVSSCFGDSDEIMQAHQELLVSTLKLAGQNVPEARFAYRYDGNLPKLLGIAQPLVEHILGFSAKLLGHADGVRRSPFDSDGRVKAALELAGLLHWFGAFNIDLRGYWDRRGEWKSLDELFRFNRHVERIFWQFGMFWSRGEDGDTRIDIPLAVDAWALLEATARGVPVSNPPSTP